MYLLLNKPKGYTSTIEGNRHDMIMELVPPQLIRNDLMPAGRLERDASGLMILTNDGELAHNILSPRKLVRKIYEITLDIPATEKMSEKFATGIQISPEECKTAQLEITGAYTCRVSTWDGRYFQIKKMFEICGAEVTELHRICIGNLFLPNDMEFGECRELSEEDVKALQGNKPLL
jgi:16S rRNA pseudouridine516 synthase